MTQVDRMTTAIEVLAEYLEPGEPKLLWTVEPEAGQDHVVARLNIGNRMWGLRAPILLDDGSQGDRLGARKGAEQRVAFGLLHALLCEAATRAGRAAKVCA